MERRSGHDEKPAAGGERSLQSVRLVLARMADALWQADPNGAVTGITLCRPSLPQSTGELDDAEVAQVEQLWHKAIRCVERFSAVYHVTRPAGGTPRSFLIQAVPVMNARDEVLYWSGHASEVERFGDTGTRFISEGIAVLSSSLNRATIVNRLVQVSIKEFTDLCAVHTVADDGSMQLEGIADRRSESAPSPEALEAFIAGALRARQPQLSLPKTESMRSAVVVPLFAGSTCIGTLSFAESERVSSFAARDLDVAVVVARQLAMALENIKTFEREQHITERFRFLAKITERLFATLDPAKILTLLLEGLVDRFADYGVAAALTEHRLRIIARSGTGVGFRLESEAELIASLRERRSILEGATVNVEHGGRFKAGPLAEPSRPQSWMMVPLYAGDAVFGAIVCCRREHHFDTNDLELLEEIGRRASLALEHAESFARERRLIQTLQQAALPSQLATIDGAQLSAIYRPAASELQVGGDWYDAYELDDHRVLLSVGDVTGHGLEASIVMNKLRHAINVVAMYERNPARILDAAERILLQRYPGSVATAFVAAVDSRKRTIAYANAGHPYPILRCKDGSLKELQADGLPLGLRTSCPPTKPVTERLDDASLLAFYTDGLIEATRDTLAGEALLHEALMSDAIFYVDSPAQLIETYCLRDQSPDDVAVLVVNFVQSQRWRFDSGDWRAARAARREFVARLEARADASSDIKAAELIFGELLANVAQHAAGALELALEWRPDAAVLHVIDRGNGYAHSNGDENGESLAEHGRGLWIAGRLGAELKISAVPGYGTHVQAALPVRPRRYQA